MVSALFDFPRDPRIHLRNEVPPEPEAMLASSARIVVVHTRSPREEARAQPTTQPPRSMDRQERRRYRRSVDRLLQVLRGAWGPPDVADPLVQAWDLDRLRRSGVRAR